MTKRIELDKVTNSNLVLIHIVTTCSESKRIQQVEVELVASQLDKNYT